MAASSLRHHFLVVLVVALALACLGAAAAHQAGSGEGYTIAGRIKIDACYGRSEVGIEAALVARGNSGDIELMQFDEALLFVNPGIDHHCFAGTSAKGFGLPAKTSNTKVILNGGQRVTFARPDGYFSFVRVDISARNPGYIQAALTETRRVLNELVLEPLKEEQYYEKREPFSIMSLLKSPMGLMVGFMVIMVVVMPKMMENIDPEEMKQAQEQMRNSPVSFSGLLARAQS
ncbi:hypothetical protein ACP70R_043415 [Stipagrostis hirtigluma subsp. patula]